MAVKKPEYQNAKKVRSSIFRVSCLNVVLQPHTRDKYIRLFETIAFSKLDAKVRGDDAIMMGSFLPYEEGKKDIYVGNLYKFLKLNAAEDWFNMLSMDAASRDDIKGIQIPEHLKPHFKKFPFVFFPDNHRFYFLTQKTGQSLSANMVKRFFDAIAERAELAEFGEVSVTVQPQQGITEEFFSMERISFIELELRKPNPDDHEDLEAEIQERLKSLNARTEKIQYFEGSNEGLKPDTALKSLASVAAENGEVFVKGKNAQGELVQLSSREYPLNVPTSYNPQVQTERDALIEIAADMHRDITRKTG